MRKLAIQSAGLMVLAAISGLVPAPAAPAHDAGSHDHAAVAVAPPPHEAAFVSEIGSAMDRMMAAMTITPSGDVDADFAAAMIPHHQGAIDMAVAELRYGKNEQLRRIAQEIIVDQQQEIVAMRLALGQSSTAPAPAPTVPPSAARVPTPN